MSPDRGPDPPGVATDSAFLSVGFFRCREAKVAACPILIDHVRLPLGYPATKAHGHKSGDRGYPLDVDGSLPAQDL